MDVAPFYAILVDSNIGAMMPQLLVRDLDAELVGLLKRRAVAHGRSAEAEHRAILESALRPNGEPFWKTAERFQKETAGRGGPTGTEIIRHYRDTRMTGIE